MMEPQTPYQRGVRSLAHLYRAARAYYNMPARQKAVVTSVLGVPISSVAYYARKYFGGKPAKAITSGKTSSGRRFKKPTLRRKKGLKKQVRELKRLAESDMGTHIDRVRHTDAVLNTGVNTAQFASFTLVSTTTLETALANLKYYNPSVPGTLTTADGTTGTFQKEFLFETVYSRITVRNNYQVPCKVSLYVCTPKKDTSISPFSAFTNGLTDVGGPGATSPLVYLTDSVQFNDLWNIKKTYKKILQPGSYMECVHSGKSFQYDPSFVDAHTLAFQSKYGAATFVVRVEGILGHDSNADEQGTLQAGVDVMYDTTLKIKYSAGADIKQIVVTNNSNTFTNTPLVSNKPISDNQNYSIA